MALRDFIEDIKHGATNVAENPAAKRQYINAVFAKLKGPARECIWGKNIKTLDDLIKTLKKRFTPGRDYAYYADKINSLQMKQGETVGAFYDHINTLVNSARGTLAESTREGAQALTSEQISLMIRPLQQTALGTFTRGLPTDIAKALVIKGCATLEEAYEEAIRYEAKMDAKLIPDTRHRIRSDNPPTWDRSDFGPGERWGPRQPHFGTPRQRNRYDAYSGGEPRYMGQIHAAVEEGEEVPLEEVPFEEIAGYPYGETADYSYVGQIHREGYAQRPDYKD